MGWKNIKEAYRISHIVAVYEGEGLCIGSPCIHNLILVSPDGRVKWGETGPASNTDLARYYQEMTADKAKVAELLNAPDTFSRSVPVYTYTGARIIEKACEEPGWPHVTHDGELMYANRFSTDKDKAVLWAKENAAAGIRRSTRDLDNLRATIAKAEAELARAKDDLAKLDADYPAVSLPPAEE